MNAAYVLIQTDVGKSQQVAGSVAGLDGVESASDVTGPYDVIARVQAADVDAIGRLVVMGIQGVAGVARTLTCFTIKR